MRKRTKKLIFIVLSILILLITMFFIFNRSHKFSLAKKNIRTNNIINYEKLDNNIDGDEPITLTNVNKTRSIYNKNDIDVNRFLQYLNDEIPLYLKNDSYIYCSERVEDNVEDMYYIVDIDGDGENEFIYYYYPNADIIKYDSSNDSFVLWLETYYRDKPLTTLQMYSFSSGQFLMYEHYVFNEFSDVILTEGYVLGEVPDTDGNPKIHYYINGEEVTEIKWSTKSKSFFELKENAPKELKYADMLSLK